MIDLHTHILPGMDDGSETAEESAALIEMELADGVQTIAVTPHFDFANGGIDEFLEKRRRLCGLLQEEVSAMPSPVAIIEGAEVLLSRWVTAEAGKKGLCYAGSGYMLVELPMDYFYDWIPGTLSLLRLGGITPVIAHTERYPYIVKNTQILNELLRLGCMSQVNAGSLLHPKSALHRQAVRLIKQDAVHLIASDTHSVSCRPPRMKAAMELIRKKFGKETAARLEAGSRRIAESCSPFRPAGQMQEAQ